MWDCAEIAKTLDFSAAEEPQAAPNRLRPKESNRYNKFCLYIQNVKSDSVFLHLAQIIDANLKGEDEGGSQNFGQVLKKKKEKRARGLQQIGFTPSLML